MKSSSKILLSIIFHSSFFILHSLSAATAGARGIVFVETGNPAATATGKASAPGEMALGPLIQERGWAPSAVVRSLDDLDRGVLARANIIVLSSKRSYNLDRHDDEVMDALVEFVRQGGGLVVLNNYGQMWAFAEFPYQLIKRFGGEVAYEEVLFPKDNRFKIGEYEPDVYSYTDQVYPPFNEGVKEVLVRSYFQMNCDHGCVPFHPTGEWKIALAAGKGVPSRPFPEMGLPFLDTRRRAKGRDTDVPLVCCRPFGKGRVVWWGPSYEFTPVDTDAKRELVERKMYRGVEGRREVQTGRFIRNVFAWAAENEDGLKDAELPALVTRAEFEKGLPRAFHLFKGVVGPRTTLSTGRSTPEEYIAKAKRMGHDFIAFLEDFTALTPENFEKLREICRAATDNSFTAYAGFTIEREDGNRQFYFGEEPLYPGKRWLTDDGRRFRSLHRDVPERGFNPKSDANFNGCPELAFFYGRLNFRHASGWYLFHESPFGATDVRNVQSMGVLTRVRGETAESAFDVYGLNNRNGQQLRPFALELVESADELNDRTYLSMLGHDGVAEFRHAIISTQGHSGYPKMGCFGCESVSNGPEIEFRTARGDVSGDRDVLYSRQFQNWPYSLSVRSKAGLKTVKLMDGEKTVRVWRPAGAKTFERKGAFTIERQHYYWIAVEDLDGRTAFSRAVNCETFVMRENQCNDHNNQLFYSRQLRPDDGEFLMTYAADCAIPDKGPWSGRLRPVGAFVIDRKYGLGGFGGHDGSPEDHPQLNLCPSVEYGGVAAESLGWVREFVAGKEGGPHNRPERVIASSDAVVADRVLDGVFPFGRKPVIHVWHSQFPVTPSAYAETRARCSAFLPKLDGTFAYQWEQTLTLTEPVPSVKDSPIVTWGGLRLSSKANRFTAFVKGERIGDFRGKRLELDRGDFLLVENPFYGHLAVYPLDAVAFDGIRFSAMGDGSVYQGGRSFSLRLVALAMHKFTEDPCALAQTALAGYGIADGKTGYTPELSRGRGAANGVCFDAVATDGALVGAFRNLKPLPGTLGLRLAGLRDDRAAVVAGPRGLRVIPVEKGVGYAALREEEAEVPVFIGHPIVCDRPEISIFVSRRQDGTWAVEAHNPTDRPVTARLRNDPDFHVFEINRELELPAGASLDL